MKYLSFAIFAVVFAFAQAEFSQLVIASCSTQAPGIAIQGISMTPMPVVNPGPVTFALKADMLRGLKGKVKADVNIIRTVAGLSLPIRCFLVSGSYFGSCVYDDICEMVKIYNDATQSTSFGTTCPFDVAPGLFDNSITVDLPNLSSTDISFFSNGDYDIKVTSSDSVGYLGCLILQFSTKN